MESSYTQLNLQKRKEKDNLINVFLVRTKVMLIWLQYPRNNRKTQLYSGIRCLILCVAFSTAITRYFFPCPSNEIEKISYMNEQDGCFLFSLVLLRIRKVLKIRLTYIYTYWTCLPPIIKTILINKDGDVNDFGLLIKINICVSQKFELKQPTMIDEVSLSRICNNQLRKQSVEEDGRLKLQRKSMSRRIAADNF